MNKHLKRFGILYVILTYLLLSIANVIWFGIKGPEIYWLLMMISALPWMIAIDLLERDHE